MSIGSFPFTAKMFVFDVEIVKLYFEGTSGNWRESSEEVVKFYFADIFDCSEYFDRTGRVIVCHSAGYIRCTIGKFPD
jgi:hypothetical protein